MFLLLLPTARGQHSRYKCATHSLSERDSETHWNVYRSTSCADEPACCQDDKSYNCSNWDGTPEMVGHLDHVLLASAQMWCRLLASAQMWNDTTSKGLHYTPSTNLADLLSRSVVAAGYYGSLAPALQPHNNY